LELLHLWVRFESKIFEDLVEFLVLLEMVDEVLHELVLIAFQKEVFVKDLLLN
jgi:hypothetical protein